MESRAQTYVDRGHARIWNRWIERRWSAFTGVTVSIAQAGPEVEWAAGRGAEFAVATERGVWGPMDLGEIEWSEECTASAATLVSRRFAADLELVTRTTAFHEAPGLVRAVTLRNTSPAPLEVGRVATDSFRVAGDGLRVYVRGFAERHDAIAWRTDERAAAVVCPDERGDRGLFIGQEAEGVLELLAPEPGVCACVVDVDGTLDPGEALELPASYVVPFSGEVMMASVSVLAQLLAARRATAQTRDRF
ncbi:MAG: hypothetical protein JXR94_18175 [Candidatus Hydrogenedentes bacterium]|nr:hypothetical protein [Candidatus Hydrogenedentota bacterium]